MTGETIALVSCVKKKKPVRCAAQDLYDSDLFRKMKCYAKQHSDKWFILSAHYGLLSPETVIEPYELTFNKMRIRDRREWADRVYAQMRERGLLHSGAAFLWLAGNKYKEHLAERLSGHPQEHPLAGMRFGQILKWLKEMNQCGAGP